MNIDEIKRQALKEIEEEDFRSAVDKYKENIRFRNNIWNKLFPYKIVLIRKDGKNV